MGYEEDLKRIANIVYRQATGYLEIIRLKLRIIGFCNKRNGLFGRLGETVYYTTLNGRLQTDDQDILRLVNEVSRAEKEIAEAEKAINARKEEDKTLRQAFSANWKAKYGRAAAEKATEDIRPAAPGDSTQPAPKSGGEEEKRDTNA